MLTNTRCDTIKVDVTRTLYRRPVCFDQCLGWLHPTPDGAAAEIAIVLCSGLRTDGITGYRSFRLLADALAKAGYPTLRFDYPGTGDSRDLATAEPWTAWQQSIHTAADWLRDQTGARSIVLCGLRMGATLAAAVAGQRTDVAGLVLLEPVLRGRSYMREIITETTVRGDAPQADGDLIIGELRLPGDTVRLINQVMLRDLVPAPDCRVGLFARASTPVLAECLAAWAACGVNVVREDFTGLEPMLRPGFMCHEPSADVARIVAWLRDAIPAGSPTPAHARVPEHVEIRLPTCTETPLHFGAEGALFGVLCRPLGQAEAGQAVLIVNHSGDPHQGGSRLNVELARRLAAEGFASLRMDFSGLGDSVAPGDAETHVYETDRGPDIAAAIDALEELGYRRFAVQGLCSGGYHVYHSALGDPRIGVVLVINLPLFLWRTGDAVELLSYIQQNQMIRLPMLKQKDIWTRLLRQGAPGLRARLTMQGAWIFRMLKAFGHRQLRFLGIGAPLTFAQDSVRRLSQRTRTLFLFTEGDAGIPGMEREFGVNRSPPGTEVRIVPDLDHSLTSGEMRRIVVEQMIRFLRQDSVPLPDALTWDRAPRQTLGKSQLPSGAG